MHYLDLVYDFLRKLNFQFTKKSDVIGIFDNKFGISIAKLGSIIYLCEKSNQKVTKYRPV